MKPASAALLALTLLAAPLTTGCAAAACKRVAADRQDFLARPATAAAPQMVLALPFAALGQELTRHLGKVPPYRLALPDLSLGGVDLDLGDASARLAAITLLPAADDHLRFQVAVGLAVGKRPITTIRLEADVRPRLDLQRGALAVSLRPQDIASVKPVLSPDEMKRLGDYLWSQVPALARNFIDRSSLDGLVRKLGSDLLGPGWPKIRDGLLGDVGTLTEFEIDLPDLPIAALALRSSPTDLELAVTLGLPAAALAQPRGRAPGTPAHLPQLRLSGAAVAELANWAIAQGQIPGRYTREGSPSPKGEFEAGVTWEPGDRPLRLHAWCTTKECTHVVFGGTPKVAVQGGELALRVDDAKIVEATGSAKVRAALWFAGLGRRTFEVSESAAASVAFDLFGRPMKASASAVQVGAAELAIGLTLTDAPAPRR